MTTDLYGDALRAFRDVFERAEQCGLNEPAAATLATVGEHGRPSSRVVLLKHFDERGFVFYTNYQSRKGNELQSTPHAALCFFWDPLMEQVRVEGDVSAVSDAEADVYWRSRARDSRIGAWASDQSRVLDDRATLERRIEAIAAKYPTDDIPRPSHWSGFRLAPNYVEFWKSIEFRLHERRCYRHIDDQWTYSLLYP